MTNPETCGLIDVKKAADDLQATILHACGVDIWDRSTVYGEPGLPQFFDGKIKFIASLRNFSKEYAETVAARQSVFDAAIRRRDVARAEYYDAIEAVNRLQGG